MSVIRTKEEMNKRWKGHRHGYLRVIEVTERVNGYWYCICHCSYCHRDVVKSINSLRTSLSCGCHQGRALPKAPPKRPGVELEQFFKEIVTPTGNIAK